MGGYGSGWPWWKGKKVLVEECQQLDVVDLLREGVLRPGTSKVRFLCWQNAVTGKQTWYLFCVVDTTDMARPWMHLFHAVARTGQKVDYRVRLTTTPCHFGGRRLWFSCPLVVNGRPCLRRVRKLYLRPGGLYFGCRACHRLSYRSCQQSDKRISALRRRFGGDMQALLAAADRGEIDQLLALEAAFRALCRKTI